MKEETTEQISVKSSDDILKELFSSIGTKDEEAAAGSQSDSSPSDSASENKSSSKPKKAKKAKKEKKKKKKKDKKRKDSSPKRKSKPLSPGPSRSSKEPLRGILSLDEWQTTTAASSSRSGGGRRSDPDYPRSPRHHQLDHDRRDKDYRRSHEGGGRRDYQHHSTVTHYDDRRDHQDHHRRDHHDEGRRRDRHQEERHHSRDYDHHDHHRRDRERGSSRQETRPPKRSASGQEDPFWDNRWEAMELQKKADAMVNIVFIVQKFMCQIANFQITYIFAVFGCFCLRFLKYRVIFIFQTACRIPFFKAGQREI